MRSNQGGVITQKPVVALKPVVAAPAPAPAPTLAIQFGQQTPAQIFSTYADGYYSIGSGDRTKGFDLHITLRKVSDSAKLFGFKTGGYPIYLYKSGSNIKYGLMNNNIFYQIVPISSSSSSPKPLDGGRQVFNIISDTSTYGPVSNHLGNIVPKNEAGITNKYVYKYLKFLPISPLSNSPSIINYDPFAVAAPAPAPASDVILVSNTDASLVPANPEAAAAEAEALMGGRRKSRKSKKSKKSRKSKKSKKSRKH